ncbi:MAG TPA: SDR family oxidoreductase [Acidimicrobiales bacterium]|nr:SDR family oxidoreductase [Acidimicrobiales bacterium]
MTDVVVVTGAARGMGLACARRLHRPGERIVLVDLDLAGVTCVADELGAGAVARRCDVRDAGSVAALAGEVRELGTFRALAHAAGISPTMADWRTVMDVDLRGSALVLRAFAPLVSHGSAAVCFASLAAHMVAAAGDPVLDAVLDDPLAEGFLDRLAALDDARITDSGGAYAWAKRGVQRLVGREAIAWGRRGGRVCSVSPGLIDTPMNTQEFAAQPVMAMMLEQTPLGRFGAADEVASLVAYLLSDAASFVSGTDVTIDGALTPALRALAPS